MNLPAYPKPSQIKKPPVAVRVFLGGREICNQLTREGRQIYSDRKLAMWDRQGRRCALQITDICKQRQGRWPVDEVQFDHQNGRGFSGGKRDDRIEVDGTSINAAVCPYCNSEKSSRRISYLDCS